MNTLCNNIKKENPLISIIIPVYNASLFIEKTIKNLVEQKVDKEIVHVNDGSTDNSLEVINKLKNKFECIRVINQENKGVSAARNNGIDNANGDYIIFIDSDDLLEKDTLEKLYSKYQIYNCDLVLSTYKICFDNNSIVDTFKYIDSGFYNIEFFLSEYYKLFTTRILHCIGTKLYKKSIIDKYNIRFNESLAYYEDINFCLSYFKKIKNVFFINESLYKYMQINADSLANKYKNNFPEISNFTLASQKELLELVYGKMIIFEDFQKIILDDFYWGVINEINHKISFIGKSKNINKLVSNGFIYKTLDNSKIHSNNRLKTTVLKSGNSFLITCLFEVSRICRNFIKLFI